MLMVLMAITTMAYSFFTTDGKYVEWSGDYLYSDMPFEVDEPVLTIKEGK